MISEALIEKPNSLPVLDQPLQAVPWSLTQNGFDNLLRHLDPNREIAGEIYEGIRRRLVRYFIARGVELPDLLADQTMDRAIKRFDDGVFIPNFQNYCFGIARLVHLETLRKRKREQAALTRLSWVANTETREDDYSQESLERLERLMNELPENERLLILAYYQSGSGKSIETRQRLAAQLGIAANAVRIRAHRIRRKLEVRFLAEQFGGYQRGNSPTRTQARSRSSLRHRSASTHFTRSRNESAVSDIRGL